MTDLSPAVVDNDHAPFYPAVVNDPIRAVRTLRRLEFVRGCPSLSPSLALVLMTAGGATTTYRPDQQPTRGELVARNYRTLYEVELGYQQLYHEHRLPSRGDAFFFHAETDITWRVIDPEAVVRNGVRDVRGLVEPRLRRRMTSRTRRFAIEQSAEAEAEVNKAVAELEFTDDFGLQVACSVRLSLDADALQHFSTLRQLTYAKAQSEGKHEVDKVEARQAQELTQQKAEFYSTMLERGDLIQWALLLVRNPDDIPLVLEGLRSDQRQAAASQIRLFEKLLEAGKLEDHMLEGATRLVQESLRAHLTDAADGKLSQRPLYKQQLNPPSTGQAADQELPPPPEADDAR